MLKIKSNVDLKKLEKFGFKRHEFPIENNKTLKTELRRYYDFKYPNAVSSINEDTRIIECWDDSFIGFGIPSDEILLEDLIKANMVEKVEE